MQKTVLFRSFYVVGISALLACFVGHGRSLQASEKPTWAVVYNHPDGLYLFQVSSRTNRMLSYFGSNSLVAVRGERSLAIDTDGTTLYQFNSPVSNIKSSTRIITKVAKVVAKNNELLLHGCTLDQRILLVTKKSELDRPLYAWNPWQGSLKRLPGGGPRWILPAPPRTERDQNSLFAYLGCKTRGGEPQCNENWLVLKVLDASAPKPRVAELAGVWDAAWRWGSGSILVVLSPARAKQLRLSSNLADWDFIRKRFAALGKGYRYSPPVVDVGPEVAVGVQEPSRHQQLADRFVLVAPLVRKSVVKETPFVITQGSSISKPYITHDKRYLIFLAWRNPRPHGLTRYASLWYYDFRTGRARRISKAANAFVAFE